APALLADESLPAPPRQARSIEKRARLIDAARALFAEKGYEATSIGDITSRAGAAAGAFYLYFSSKRQLLLVMMSELLERLEQLDLRPADRANAREGLRRFLAQVFETDLQSFGVVRAWQEASLTDAELAKMRAAIERWTEARILRVFRLLQRLPNARRGRDLRAFARMMDRHFWSLLARGAGMPRRELQRELRLAADVIHHYLFSSS
ncbi:MAG TPA: TetR/AcrR family transcriptional regulator, partial [Vicinamibacterales bacterium]|nr:TetR/AcrR family transcriptional regulator [Vicinamibacterales bacterium]